MADLKLSQKELETLNQVDLTEVAEDSFFEETSNVEKPKKTRQTRPRSFTPYAQKFESLTNEANSICDNQEVFDGLRLEYNRPVSDQLTLTHVCQGSVDFQGQGTDPGEYLLIAQSIVGLDNLFSRNQTRVQESDTRSAARGPTLPDNRFIGVARFGSRGDFMSRLQVSTPSWLARVMCTGRGKQHNWQTGLEYTGTNSHLSLQLSTNQGIVGSYVGEVYPNRQQKTNGLQIHLGGQINYVHSQAASALALVARFEKGTAKNKQVLTLMGSDSPSPLSNLPGVGQLCYARKLDLGITWATRLLLMRNQNSDLYGFMAHASIGYEYKLNSSGSVKGYIDSTGRVSLVSEQVINPILSLTLCLDADYAQKEYKGGVAVAFHL